MQNAKLAIYSVIFIYKLPTLRQKQQSWQFIRKFKVNMNLIGRKKELDILNRLLESKRPEFLAFYGRRDSQL